MYKTTYSIQNTRTCKYVVNSIYNINNCFTVILNITLDIRKLYTLYNIHIMYLSHCLCRNGYSLSKQCNCISYNKRL